MLLEEVDLWVSMETMLTTLTFPISLAKHDKKMAKTKCIIFDFVKDHLIPHIAEKRSTKELYDTLTNLY